MSIEDIRTDITSSAARLHEAPIEQSREFIKEQLPVAEVQRLVGELATALTTLREQANDKGYTLPEQVSLAGNHTATMLYPLERASTNINITDMAANATAIGLHGHTVIRATQGIVTLADGMLAAMGGFDEKAKTLVSHQETAVEAMDSASAAQNRFDALKDEYLQSLQADQ